MAEQVNLTPEQVQAIKDEYRDTDATIKSLAEKYDRSEVTIGSYTKGIVKVQAGENVDPEDKEIEKAEKNNRLQTIEALKKAKIGPEKFVTELQALLDSSDPQYKRDALKMYADIMGLSAKTDKSAGATKSNITDQRYTVKLPTRKN